MSSIISKGGKNLFQVLRSLPNQGVGSKVVSSRGSLFFCKKSVANDLDLTRHQQNISTTQH
jgi:hypothetical protein